MGRLQNGGFLGTEPAVAAIRGPADPCRLSPQKPATYSISKRRMILPEAGAQAKAKRTLGKLMRG